jgi:1-deoxy-D-xylulose-5-phosphate reductoisomerase
MRSVISYAMSYPNRISSGVAALDLANNSPLEFYPPNFDKFVCLRLAFDALKQGGSAMGTVNAANEVAVDAFLNHQIKFLEIPNIIEQTLTQAKHSTLSSLDAIIANDQHARVIALEIVGQHA